MNEYGLVINADYADQGVEVKHADKGWLPLTRTSAKMVFFANEDGSEGRMTVAKLEEVRGLEDAEPAVKDEAPVIQDEMELGIMSNTDYSEAEVEVKHSKKGWLPLNRTSEKLLFVDEDGSEKRMTLATLEGVRNLDGEGSEVLKETVSEEEPEADPQMGNDFASGQVEDGDEPEGVEYD